MQAQRAAAKRIGRLAITKRYSRYRYDMQSTNHRPRFLVWGVHAAACLLAFSHFVMAQSASPDANTDVLNIRIAADGVCHFLDDSAPCEQLGKNLLTKHQAQSKHIHIAVDRASTYELVAATLKSLDGTGFRVGFVNYDEHARQNDLPQRSEVAKSTVTEDGQPIQPHAVHLGERYYPPESRLLGEQGTCLVKITVTAEGEIRDVTLTKSTGYPRLDQACIDGFKGAHMRPAIRDGKAVTLTKEIPIKWTLNIPASPPYSH